MHSIEICKTPSYIAESIISDYISDNDVDKYSIRSSVKEKTERAMRVYAAEQALEKIRDDPYENPLNILLREKQTIVSLSKALINSKHISALDASGDAIDCIIDVLSDVLNERKYA